MSATSTLIQQPAPELLGGCSLIAGGEASAASVQVWRGASSTREQSRTSAGHWPAAAHGSSYGRDRYTLFSGRSRICSSPSALADLSPVVAGMRPLFGHCCRWPVALNRTAMRRLPVAQTREGSKGGFSIRRTRTTDPMRSVNAWKSGHSSWR